MPTAGVAVTVGDFFGAKGSVGTTMSKRFAARCSSKHGQCCAISKWLALRGSVFPWAVCGRWTDRSVRIFLLARVDC